MDKEIRAIFEGLAPGQVVWASSYYAIDARRTNGYEDAMDVGPEGQEPWAFWVVDATAFDAKKAAVKAAEAKAIEISRTMKHRGWSWTVEVDGMTVKIGDWGYGQWKARGPAVDWTDYVIKEVRK